MLFKVSQTKINQGMTINILTESLVHKSKLLKSIITSITKLKELVSGTEISKEMRKRIKERSDRLSLPHEPDPKEFADFECFNDLHGTMHFKT